MPYSELPPSDADIWGDDHGCTGWVSMTRTEGPTEQSLYAMEGSAAHELAAELLRSLMKNVNMPDMLGKKASNGVVYTPRLLQSAVAYVEAAAVVLETPGVIFGIEEHVECHAIHPLCSGVSDLYAYNPLSRVLYVWEFKSGYVAVNVYENLQLITYAAGVIAKLGLDIEKIRVSLRVVQPNAFHKSGIARDWLVFGKELKPYFKMLSRNANRSLTEPEFNSGAHCSRCPGRHICPTALQAGASLYEAAGAATPVALSPAAVGVQLTILRRACRQLQELENAFEAQAQALIEKGSYVPGWELRPGTRKLKWSKPAQDVMEMGDQCGVDLRKDRELVTPTQAIASGVDQKKISKYSTLEAVSFSLVQEDATETKRIFNNVNKPQPLEH